MPNFMTTLVSHGKPKQVCIDLEDATQVTITHLEAEMEGTGEGKGRGKPLFRGSQRSV